ncbi:Abi family protein [Sulfitobacter sp. M57]|uniref:Abi family protein n=5 Tax=Sulfitobacter TaxID=60136 RepID=UPI0023E0B494|nr:MULTISPECIES: Abi family protein [unclassified Sulfitobacter]MDF3416716.1 Abi family protein [Sulfitobacter sp. KE5]MDF3424200.1 Abi family protein [Sulfitobacter sp. KE43]MDF3435287.1 Abi family protein [Sulfitobacter sp. KE42]MDF3460900.1 Abi family protein [Sulfitobacter sp. S74]MDF3464795.1 Abi family protein [Sulfitobacter sp. Ks18]
MSITDEARAKACLSRIGYYRLSAYWYPNRKSEKYIDATSGREKTRVLDDFRDGTHFSDALDFYVFDKKLRLLVLDALERVEVGIRTDIAVLLGTHDPWVHRDPSKLHGNFSRPNVPPSRLAQIQNLSRQRPQPTRRAIAQAVGVSVKTVNFVIGNPRKASQSKLDEWLSRLDDKFKKSKEDFAKHFKEKYPNDTPPIWVAVELWDFGTLSHFFSGMKIGDQNTIAAHYGLPSGDILEGWLRNLNDVRNFCAHHSRLWNRSMPFIPMWTSTGDIVELDHLVGKSDSLSRFYASVVILRHLLKVINPTTEWSNRLIEHVQTLPANPYVTLQSAGFPEDWIDQDIWK